MERAARAARALHRAQLTRERAEARIAAAETVLRVVALQQRTTELRLGDYLVEVGERVSVSEVAHTIDQLSLC
jgi:hypothetical protein